MAHSVEAADPPSAPRGLARMERIRLRHGVALLRGFADG